MPAGKMIALHSHPALPCPRAALEAGVSRTVAGGLMLHYRLRADLDRLRIPPPQPPEAVDGLWQHTCFEAFVAVDGSPHYREFNFSPSGCWAAYAFADYRRRDAAFVPPASPRIDVGRHGDCLELDAELPAALLPPCGQLILGLTAVVESADGSLSYWALAHPGERPDFHHRGGFSLVLPTRIAG